MPATTLSKTITVALIGNPNTGKSTLFSALAGVRQRIGNYPGVTVEKKLGRCELGGQSFALVDLPGTYSLAPRSPDEMIAVDVLLGRRDDVHAPDVVLCIVDASNLERNLYLVSQVLELGLPTVLALNMVDVAETKGVKIDIELLRKRLQVPVVPVQANRKSGLAELGQALASAASQTVSVPPSPFPQAFQDEVETLAQELRGGDGGNNDLWPRYLVERLLLDTSDYLSSLHLSGWTSATGGHVAAARERLKAAGCPVPSIEPVSRYRWVGETLKDVVQRPKTRQVTFSDKLDKVLTHKLGGTLIFVSLMALMFYSVFTLSAPLSDLIEAGLGVLAGVVEANLADGPLRSLIVDGIIAGVGGVLVFLPQIFILFLFIGVLEDCGYMARAAYLMDKLMSRVGLSGKSFIPMLSSFGCAIPGIMATRVIENRRDRLTTMMVAPLMSCSARLPVYTLLIGAFIPLAWQTVTMLAMYSIGVLAAVIIAWVLKKTVLAGATPPFIMELPSYKVPSLSLVLWRMWENGWSFIKRAGTLIFAVSVIVWFLAYYPRNETDIDAATRAQQQTLELQVAEYEADLAVIQAEPKTAEQEEREKSIQAKFDASSEELSTINNQIAGTHLRNSFLGRAGHFIEPAVRPLGWDWRIGCAAIASFPAREVVVATLGVIYNLGSDQEDTTDLRKTLAGATWDGTEEKVFSIPVALSVMVFFALCAQCVSTLAVMKRETNSYRWPIFSFVYMTVLAYVAALLTYQIGIRL